MSPVLYEELAAVEGDSGSNVCVCVGVVGGGAVLLEFVSKTQSDSETGAHQRRRRALKFCLLEHFT